MSILVLYGSETGTAQDVAESLWRECRQRNVPARIAGLDEYNAERLRDEMMVVFVIATSGQGELPTNMRSSWSFLLRKSLPKDWLHGVSYAVVALGDSSYSKYNFAGKKMFRRLLQLGANHLLPVCLCDDQHELGIDGALTPFREHLFEAVSEKKWFENIRPLDVSVPIDAKFTLDYTTESIMEPIAGDYVPVEVLSNKRVTAESHFQDTRLVSFDIGCWKDKLSYKPGDVLMVQPCNPVETVRIAIEALQYSDEVLDRPFRIIANDENIKAPPAWLIGEVTTIRDCLNRLFDMQHIPRKSFFEVLGGLSTDPDEKERLLELAKPEMLDELLAYSTRARRTSAEALRDFYRTAASITPERLFDLFPYIRARAFSIASCPITHDSRIELLVAKVQYKARMAEVRRGLCSTFISRLQPGDKVWVRVRPGTFRFPSPSVPSICIGPGTGVAPFRSLLNFRSKSDLPLSESILFFGCRGKERDFYFSEEWPSVSHCTVLTAFSRDQEEKVYVQDVIAENAALVWELIARGAYIFIAGSSGDMPKAVCAAIDRIGSMNGIEQLIDKLEKASRIQYETWE